MEMLSNSVVVDARLFPKVDRVTVLEAAQFMNAKLRHQYVEGQTMRLDTAYLSWNGDAMLGKLPQILMALIIPKRSGLTLLRQHLGSEIENFTHLILDPAQPGVATLVGPRALPSELPEGLDMVSVDDALAAENFDKLHGTAQGVLGLLHFIKFKQYTTEADELLCSLNNGWNLRMVNGQTTPVFTLERAFLKPDDINTEVPHDPDCVAECCADPDAASDNSYALPA